MGAPGSLGGGPLLGASAGAPAEGRALAGAAGFGRVDAFDGPAGAAALGARASSTGAPAAFGVAAEGFVASPFFNSSFNGAVGAAAPGSVNLVVPALGAVGAGASPAGAEDEGGVVVAPGAGPPLVGAVPVPVSAGRFFSRSAFSLAAFSSSVFFCAARCAARSCRRFESWRLEMCARDSDVTKKRAAVIDVSRVRKFPAPDEPKTVWLPAPPNAMPMPPPLPACNSTTRMRNKQTTM